MRKWFPALLVACGFALSIGVYGRLPEHVPIDLRGLMPVAFDAEVDAARRPVAAFFLPTLALLLFLLLHEAGGTAWPAGPAAVVAGRRW